MSEAKMERKLARVKKLDLEIEDHGILVVRGGFEVESVGYYGMPDYCINTAFLYRLLDVFNYRKLRDLDGQPCWLTARFELGRFFEVERIEPLFEKDGTAFVIADWQAWTKANDLHSPYELRTGKKPNAR